VTYTTIRELTDINPLKHQMHSRLGMRKMDNNLQRIEVSWWLAFGKS